MPKKNHLKKRKNLWSPCLLLKHAEWSTMTADIGASVHTTSTNAFRVWSLNASKTTQTK